MSNSVQAVVEDLFAKGLMRAFDSKIMPVGDDRLLLQWGDYWDKRGKLTAFITSNALDVRYYDNGYVATFCALITKEQNDKIVEAFGADIGKYKGIANAM